LKRVAVLGSTGSIGRNCLRVIESHPERFRAVALAGGKNYEAICDQIERHHPELVSCGDPSLAGRLRARFSSGTTEILCGAEGLEAVAGLESADIVASALVGSVGLMPTYKALQAGKNVALANKETMVMAGRLLTELAEKKGSLIIPVDSEHSAIHQCLAGDRKEAVRRLILTGSGGPFRKLTPEALDRVSPEQALKHPVWRMGRKITIDSATLANKGLEVIEARWLFGAAPDRIAVLIHPECVIHSMVEFVDGSILCQMGAADMRIPIQYALSYPERLETDVEKLDLISVGALTFEEPDVRRFPCLKLAYTALREGDRATVAYTCSNDVANERFLSGGLAFAAISRVIEETMARIGGGALRSMEEVLELEVRSRREAEASIRRLTM
jgi:1-deoxy-D-xylulose-5-phosphate reductoisomerase